MNTIRPSLLLQKEVLRESDYLGYPTPHCPNCGYPLKLIGINWYCEKCQKYHEILPIEPISRKGTKEGERKFKNRMLIWISVAAVVLPLVYALSAFYPDLWFVSLILILVLLVIMISWK